jgi:hypothetical protein
MRGVDILNGQIEYKTPHYRPGPNAVKEDSTLELSCPLDFISVTIVNAYHVT